MVTTCRFCRSVVASRQLRPLAGCAAIAATVACVMAASSKAAIIVQRVTPTRAHTGDLVQVFAAGYLGARPWPALPVIMVPAAQAPTTSACVDCVPQILLPISLRQPRLVVLGSISKWRSSGFDGGAGSLTFRVPAIEPGVYQLLLFCNRCVTGPEGSLINVRKVTVTVIARR
jgi:hypothetical protein